MPAVKKPVQFKEIAGTKRRDRDSAAESAIKLDLVEDIPKPPAWLPNTYAKKEWKRLAPILFNNRLLTEAALSPLAQLCALHGKIVQTYKFGGMPSAAEINCLRGLQNDFGLTPIAQGKIGAPGAAKKKNRFDKNKI